MRIEPKNWNEFQHYKDRAPPWIKLHKTLLDNFEYQSLPVASRALAPMLWLLASDHDRGEIDAAPKKLAFRLRMTEREVTDALKPLIDNGFFTEIDGASEPLAECQQAAMPEAEKRRVEKEEKARAFEQFWTAYPRKEAKKDAETAWVKVDAPIAELLTAIERSKRTEGWMKSSGQFIPLPATWLRGKRWQDEQPDASVTVPTNPAAIFTPPPKLTEAELAANRVNAAKALSDLKRGGLKAIQPGAH